MPKTAIANNGMRAILILFPWEFLSFVFFAIHRDVINVVKKNIAVAALAPNANNARPLIVR
ncbi:hypothetical protein D3C86_2062550 [compost metagenome]